MSTAVTPISDLARQDTNLIIGGAAKKPDLRDKAIDIKGKQYVQVSHRVVYFNETYPEGSITTELISSPDAETVVIKATVMPTFGRCFTGYSQATWGDGYINKTSALENAETSAVGRALAFMGIGVLDSIASVDEVNKATNRASTSGQPAPRVAPVKKPAPVPTPAAKTVAPVVPTAPAASPIATDSDIPANIGDLPTPEERGEFLKRLKGYIAETSSEKIKKFISTKLGSDFTTNSLKKRQWEEILSSLDAAKTSGSLADLVK